MARPKHNIDWEYVDEMLMADCEGTEIAEAIGMHPNTLYERCKKDHNIGFSEYLTIKKAKGNGILKMEQWKMATLKAVESHEWSAKKAMLIWLGKNRLGQSEKQDVKESITIAQMESPLEWPKE